MELEDEAWIEVRDFAPIVRRLFKTISNILTFLNVKNWR